MNETDKMAAISKYLEEVSNQFHSGHAREHSYRPALERLMMSFDKVHAVNEPKHSEHGAPDFVFLSNNNNDLILGYAEAKDIGVSLDKTEKTEQMERYGGYANLFLTDYLEFRFFKNGEKTQTISLGHVKNGLLYKTPENGTQLMRELEAFLDQTPETIKSGKRLAKIMGGKARRIRDNVDSYLSDDNQGSELDKMFQMMKKMLVHDLSEQKFADMYAQTLVYGLFVARYGDSSPDTFTRGEARDLVPASNPFLRHFFDHIVGPNFDARLGYIVDELCEIFSVSDVQEIVHKHLRIQDATDDVKDPIIHFYEDFLQEYDPVERKKMGAYYTPIPVVKFIVRNVDKILKEEFGIAKGLASDEKISYEIDTQPWRKKGERKDRLTKMIETPRVQILDPAVGTATFLNETIKFIHEEFKGQEGRWPAYVQDNLIKRLHGFELMMAPYTIAHLKLGMTLKETGVDQIDDRLGVYLTNTLEEGIPQQPDLFSFGLAEAVSEESRHAADIKSERPIMVVMGNPPYSGESSNKTKYASSLVDKYKFEPGGKQKLNEKNIKWISNDYVKFIAFAEEMIVKNGEGVVAMITSNTFLDGLIYRGMRWRLTDSFDKIYIYDLNGSSIKASLSDDDESVFDILQGTSIIIGIRKSNHKKERTAKVLHANLVGRRKKKFEALGSDKVDWVELNLDSKNYNFSQTKLVTDESFVSLGDLFLRKSMGLLTKNDSFCIDIDKDSLWRRVDSIHDMDSGRIREVYGVKKDSRDWKLDNALGDIKSHHSPDFIRRFNFRPFDARYTFYTGQSKGFMAYPQRGILQHMDEENVGLIIQRQTYGHEFRHTFVTDNYTDLNFISNLGGGTLCPLYLYHPDGTRTPNFAPAELSALTRQLTSEPSPEDILDYVYAILHSPTYREKYKEFLKIDFPRVPIPTQADFDRLVPLGRELRQLHLMKSPLIEDYKTTYSVAGDNLVEKLRFEDEKVWINDDQSFGNVPETAWNFYIGGYQPAQKWLKDRKGRNLSSDDLDHYQKIIKILLETDRVMKQIG